MSVEGAIADDVAFDEMAAATDRKAGTGSARRSRKAELPASAGSAPAADAATTLANLGASLKALRRRAELTLAELAARAGVGKSTLAQIESGRANPSIETLFALAVALNVPLAHLLAAPTPEITLLRRGEGAKLDSSDAQFRAELLTSTGRRGSTELFVLQLEDGGKRLSDAHSPGTVEHVFLVEGRMRVGPTASPVELEPGDLASYDADTPHLYEALAPGTRAFALLDYPM